MVEESLNPLTQGDALHQQLNSKDVMQTENQMLLYPPPWSKRMAPSFGFGAYISSCCIQTE